MSFITITVKVMSPYLANNRYSRKINIVLSQGFKLLDLFNILKSKYGMNITPEEYGGGFTLDNRVRLLITLNFRNVTISQKDLILKDGDIVSILPALVGG